MKKYDVASSIFTLLFGLGFALGGFHYGFGTWKSPGPGWLPVVFGLLLTLLSAMFLAVTLISPSRAIQESFEPRQGNWRPILLTLLGLVAYMLLLTPLGFILTTLLFVSLLLRFVWGKRWLVAIGMGLGFAFVSYGLFSLLLQTPLPKGWM